MKATCEACRAHAQLIDCWGLGEIIFFRSVPHAPSLRFISRAFTPVNQMFTRGGGAPDFIRRTFFLLPDFGMWGSQARRCPLESRGGENVQLGKASLLKI